MQAGLLTQIIIRNFFRPDPDSLLFRMIRIRIPVIVISVPDQHWSQCGSGPEIYLNAEPALSLCK
jgi:hypothetical protein